VPDDPSHSFTQLNQEAAASAQQKPADSPVQPCPLSKKVRVRIVAKDQHFVVYKNARYRLEVEYDSFEGNTGSSGIIDHEIPAISKTGRLSVWPKDSPETPIVFNLVIEPIDPIDLETGVRTRLRNLGISGLSAFQSEFQLEPAEQLTSEARQRLQEAFSERDQAQSASASLPPGLVEGWEKLFKKPRKG
jgi:hypothetical protein